MRVQWWLGYRLDDGHSQGDISTYFGEQGRRLCPSRRVPLQVFRARFSVLSFYKTNL